MAWCKPLGEPLKEGQGLSQRCKAFKASIGS
jgi:hypothetical protein